MKVRLGFVSNSSTSSFLLYGIDMESEDIQKILGVSDEDFGEIDAYEEMENKVKGTVLEYQSAYGGEYHYLGRSWDDIKDDETGKQFKESVEKAIEKLLGKKTECDTCKEAWRDG